MATLRPSIDFNFKTDPKAILSRGTGVYTGLSGNPTFTDPPPPIDLTVFKSALEALSVAIADAMDGGKKVIADRDRKKEVEVKMLRQLAHYVEAHCQDNLNILLSSGFAVLNRIRKPAEPVSESIRRIEPGGAGANQHKPHYPTSENNKQAPLILLILLFYLSSSLSFPIVLALSSQALTAPFQTGR